MLCLYMVYANHVSMFYKESTFKQIYKIKFQASHCAIVYKC